MARTLDPKSKAGFVRSQPLSLSPAEVVAKAKAAGITMDVYTVYGARAALAKKKGGGSAGAPKAPKLAAPVRAKSVTRVSAAGEGDLVAEIERIVEAKVSRMLKERFRHLFG